MTLLVGMAIPAHAAPRDKAAIMKAARRTLAAKSGKYVPRTSGGSALQVLKENEAYTVVGMPEGGFAIISNDDLAPEVLGFSSSKFNEKTTNENFKWYLQAAEKAVSRIVAQGKPLTAIKPDPNLYPQKVEAFINVEWGQQDPYNRLCPTAGKNGSTPGQNYNGGELAVTGCVATAMAQIMHFNKYPKSGVGTKTLSVKQADGSNKEFTVDFTQSNYAWNDMLNQYKKGAFSNEEANAVALLMRDCGFAANMNYGSDVSGTPINAAFLGLKEFFSYPESLKLLYRMDYIGKDAEWMDMIFREMNERRAILYGAGDKNPMNGGHAFVFCGYDEEGKVYVNWGWNGEDNGYYDINLLNPANYQFSEGQSMIIGFAPDRPAKDQSMIVSVTTPGTLSQKISEAEQQTLQSLTVSGPLNATDLKFLRSLAGRDIYGKATDGALETLNLQGATIVAGGEPYLIDGDKSLITTDNEIPERAFFGCQSLKSITLPQSITNIGDGAFGKLYGAQEIVIPQGDDKDYMVKDNIIYSKDGTEMIEVLPLVSRKLTIDANVKRIHPYCFAGCQRITDIAIPETVEEICSHAFEASYAFNSIRVYAKTPCKLGESVFTDINKSITKLFVPYHSETVYASTDQWKDFSLVYDNLKPFGTDIFARTATRVYGEANPEFGYRFEGDDFVGEPLMSCDADATANVGEYEIKVERGTVESDMLQLFSGILVITQAQATITVDDKTIKLGEEYTPTYQISGLKNGETADVLTYFPTFTYRDKDGNYVNSFTEEGVYTVHANNAAAQNYTFDYVAGTVTVSGTTAINELNAEQDADQAPYYTLEGVRVKKPTKGGVYIHRGKKVVIK